MTWRPLRPCRVTSKLASKRGTAVRPASRAISARTFASAARSTCSPVAGTSVWSTGIRHGCPGARSGGLGFTLCLFSPMERHLFGIGKGDFAVLKTILRGQGADRPATIGGQPGGAVPFRAAGKHIARESCGQRLIVRGRQRCSVGGLPAVESLSDAAHF